MDKICEKVNEFIDIILSKFVVNKNIRYKTTYSMTVKLDLLKSATDDKF